jgi:uncharacterized damage-inducible protein DinB
MPVPEAAREYLFKALLAQPVVAAALLEGRGDDADVWDRRLDADRFSLREALAHLADWEPVWLERVRRIASEDHPFLPSVDESLLVVQNSYDSTLPSESLSRYGQGREALVSFLRSVPESAWDRTADREFVGVVTLHQQVAMALSHDGYHMNQIVEWLRA